MSPLRILVTGSRTWTDAGLIGRALTEQLATYSTIGLPVLIHGGAPGADMLADQVWRAWCNAPFEFVAKLADPEVYPARDFPSPRARNQHMVDLGATVCVAFGSSWASGTGMCARMARWAGIRTVDYGVDTRAEARPR